MHSREQLQRAHKEYLESRVLSASPVILIQMIYDVAITNVKAAMEKLAGGDAMGRARDVSKAQAAIAELMVSLDHEAGGPLGRELERLYRYAQAEILKGHAQRSVDAFKNAQSVLVALSEGWAGVCEQIAANQDLTAQTAAEVEKPPADNRTTTLLASYQQAVGSESRYWSC
jgi:flagellar protein FliS